MFNPEKLLGGLISSGLGGRGNSLVPGGVALGLLGVAMEAVSHYMNNSQTPSPATPPLQGTMSPPGPAGRPSMPPPPPPSGMTASPPPGIPLSAPPPLPPGVSQFVPPPLPAMATTNDAVGPPNEAILLIRAMIAAANADGVIDAGERAQILKRLQGIALTDEEKHFIELELADPKDAAQLVLDVKSPETARKVYTVSLLAIEVDTEAERTYMRTLGNQLGMDPATLSDIHSTLGIAPF